MSLKAISHLHTTHYGAAVVVVDVPLSLPLEFPFGGFREEPFRIFKLGFDMGGAYSNG